MSDITDISKQAAVFLTALKQDEGCDKTALTAWLEASPMHRIVYNDLAEDWALMKDVEKPEKTRLQPTHINEQPRAKRKGGWAWVAVAATVVLTLGAIVGQIVKQQTQPLVYETARIQQTIELDDSSVLTLNVGSKVTVNYSKDMREIVLDSGDLAIEVADDIQRPLVIVYGAHRFTALGTAFTVTTRPKLQLLVTEHSVGVTSGKSSQLVVEEGQGVALAQTWHPVKEEALREINAWQESKHIFSEAPLKDVLDTLGPYFDERIRLVNLSALNEKVSGSFDMTSPKASLQLIAEGMDLKVRYQPGVITLY